MNKIKYESLRRIIKVTLILNSPFLTSCVFFIYYKNKAKKREYRVLCIGRSIFYDDINAINNFGQKIELFSIHKSYFGIIMQYFISKNDLKRINEGNYYTDNIANKDRERLFNYYLKMIPHLKRLLQFDAVMSGNIGYLEQQEFSRACSVLKVPFIVLHKEGMVIPQLINKFFLRHKGKKFYGSLVLFYNNKLRDGFLNLNLPGVEEKIVKVVGIPRFDYLFKDKNSDLRLNINKSNSKKILFFSFMTDNAFSLVTSDQEILSKIKKREENFYKNIFKFAKQNPDYQVTIKTKLSDHYLKYVSNLREKLFDQNIDNLVITNIGNSMLLINSHDIVAGFNSTALFESIIIGKPIISPFFGDLVGDLSWSFFDSHPDLVNYSKNYNDLCECIEKLKNFTDYPTEIKNDFLSNFIGNFDGKACHRVENEIVKSINNNYKKNK